MDYRNVPVAEVLKDLGDKAGVRFTFEEKLLETADNVTCEAKDVEAGRVATRILLPRGLKMENPDGAAVSVVKRDPLDEFKVKRENVFEFAGKPTVTRDGDKVAISFAAKGWCDVTVGVEDTNGKIIRHLASDILGDNAPEPFQWNSKKQALIWDGKNDKGEYVDDKDAIVVRVSMGLKPQYERSLYWEPKRRVARDAPLMVAAEEGVYILDSNGVNHLRLFDHKGDYVRTIYPFPADKMKDVKGLEMVKRVGQYGNEDSDGPKSRVPLGGDGVGLFSPHYVATHTDRRLFIADAGNARIVSVKLDYHTEARVALRDVPDPKEANR